jgi:hypothetical protein
MKFPDAIAEMRRSGKLNASVLVYMAFKDDPQAVWLGIGDLKTLNDIVWTGVGTAVNIEGGAQQAGLASPNLNITLAATAEMIQKAKDSYTVISGRRISVAVQFFGEAWQPVDNYIPIYNGLMDRVSFQREADKKTITLYCESPFVRKHSPRIQYWTAADQNVKYPGDRLFDTVAGLQDKIIIWPVFY